MSPAATNADADLKTRILAALDENRVMSLATIRPDGWPQVTMVGYVHDDLTLYFSVAPDSQKLANVRHDPRVSIALGRDTLTRICGLSMAARVSQVTDPAEVDRLNKVVLARYPKLWIFAPRDDCPVMLRATPKLISLIDTGKDTGEAELLDVSTEIQVHRIEGRS